MLTEQQKQSIRDLYFAGISIRDLDEYTKEEAAYYDSLIGAFDF